MIRLIRRLVHAFLWDEYAAMRWMRAGLAFAGSALAQVLAIGPEKLAELTPRAWLFHVLAAVGSAASVAIVSSAKKPSACGGPHA